MKKITTFLIALIALSSNAIWANNDTLYVEDFVTPLNETIAGDTNTNGERLHKVYKLKHSTKYKIKVVLKNYTYKLDIVGEPVPEGDFTFPAVITGAYKNNGNYQNTFIVAHNDVSVKNIYFMGWADNNVGKASVILAQMVDNSTTNIENCIIDGSWNKTVRINGNYSKLFFENNHIRNCGVGAAFFSGQGVCLQSVVMDTVIIKNSTFSNINAYALVSYGDMGHNYIEFDHNTVYNIGCNPIRIWRATNMKVTNNIFVNTLFLGSTQTEAEGDWFDQGGEAPAIFSLLPLGDTWATDYADYPALKDIKEEDRKVTFSNNAIYFNQEIKDLWTAQGDDFMPTGITNNRTQGMIDDDDAYPNIVFENNFTDAPGFNTNHASGGDHAAKAVEQFNAVRNTGAGIDWTWGFFEANGVEYKFIPQVPLPENFEYTNSSYKTAATDGKPLGDLNWFGMAIGINDKNVHSTANEFALNCYPNPSNGNATLTFNVKSNETISIEVFNAIGQKVSTLVNNQKFYNEGTELVNWDAKNLNNGIYFVVVNNGVSTTAQRVSILK